MQLRGHRVPMAFSLLVWFALWEVIGRLEVISLIPPLSETLRAMGEVVQSSTFVPTVRIRVTPTSAARRIASSVSSSEVR